MLSGVVEWRQVSIRTGSVEYGMSQWCTDALCVELLVVKPTTINFNTALANYKRPRDYWIVS